MAITKLTIICFEIREGKEKARGTKIKIKGRQDQNDWKLTTQQ